ncbi:N-acetylmuramoyl-L-alanine amidase family protein [Paenibacillus harenae]|uniref:N-acetylmuramoyl-L-alanine amidase n=1 Tax=Paenibacillus harenae TaxID=306543 RepID=A0ABT9TXK5_PAEHA|nr:N-acetylmuramoyl-L-alanine amidase [Paenibacillus harenae]MDQ0110784.1 N-acetylmuramoyl-L-alanine amidase [Paenibacillus harenae]
MVKLIAVDDGHGLETPGKRTPSFPDGMVMKENEFNRVVAAYLDAHLKRCGFRTLLVAPGDTDIPLNNRTTAANNAKADFYISIHANAYGAGWNGARGIETYYYPGSTAGKQAADIIHAQLVKGTPMPNRGVKEANFHVLRETTMPAVLVELGFMTNREDAELLRSGAYRAECAEELAKGICQVFGVPYIPVSVVPDPIPDPDTDPDQPEEGTAVLSVEDANKIIPFLSAAYMATTDKEARKEFNRLANELRKASGQEPQ